MKENSSKQIQVERGIQYNLLMTVRKKDLRNDSEISRENKNNWAHVQRFFVMKGNSLKQIKVEKLKKNSSFVDDSKKGLSMN